MKKFLKIFSIPALLIGDTVITLLSSFFGIFVRFEGKIPDNMFESLFSFGVTASLLMIVFGIIAGCYYNNWERASVGEVLKQFLVVSVVFFILSILNRIMELHIPGSSVFISAILILSGTIGIRMISRFYHWGLVLLRKAQNSGDCRILIIGAGEVGISLARNLVNKPKNGMIPVGYIDDNSKLWNRWLSGLPVFGGREMLKGVILRHKINEVIIAIHDLEKSAIQDIFEKCKATKCKLKRYDTMHQVDEYDINKVNIREVGVEELLGRNPVRMDMNDVRSFLGDKVVMVTGGAGSIGSELCRQVLSYGCSQLIIYDFHENGLFEIDKELSMKYSRSKYELVLGSIRDSARLDTVFSQFKPEVVFHAAAHKHVPMMEWNPFEAVKNNILGTMNVARKADEYKVKKFILISTDKAVNPPNIMGATKRVAELCLQLINTKSETEYAAVRFGNVLGSNGSVVPIFKQQIADGGPIRVTHPEIKRYFMTIPEAVQLVLQAGAMAFGGEIFVLDMGIPIKIYDLAVTLIQLSGLEPEKDIKIEFTGLRPGEKLFEEISLSEEEVSKTPNNKIYIMKQQTYNFTKLEYQIDLLIRLASKDNEKQALIAIQELVPTYNYREYKKPEMAILPLKSVDVKKPVVIDGI